MAPSSFDCYLCGTDNPADADFCQKCSGQLLKLPAVEDDGLDGAGELDGADKASDDGLSKWMNEKKAALGDDDVDADADTDADSGDIDDDVDQGLGDDKNQKDKEDAPGDAAAANPIKRRFQRTLSTSVEDQRLSDALGLNKDIDELDYVKTEVTSIPTARAAENIPVIGTGGARPIDALTDDGPVGKIAYVVVAMLVLATGWFAYDSLLRERVALEPDSIGFVDTTTTIPGSTTTTEAPDLSWTADDVQDEYANTIVRIVAFDCVAGVNEPLGEPLTGVALDEKSVILDPSTPATADVVRIVTLSGSSRIGLVTEQDGVLLATAGVRTRRHLDIEETSDEPAFYLGYDFESNRTTTTEAPQGLDAEIAVSRFGQVHEVRIGDRATSAEALANINLDVIATGPQASQSPCNSAGNLEFVAAEPLPSEGTDGDENADDDGEDDTE